MSKTKDEPFAGNVQRYNASTNSYYIEWDDGSTGWYVLRDVQVARPSYPFWIAWACVTGIVLTLLLWCLLERGM